MIKFLALLSLMLSPGTMIRLSLIAIVVGAFLLPLDASAQTRFMAPDTAVDLSRYQTPHECIAAFRRMVRVTSLNGPWLDTAEYNPTEQNHPLPALALATIRQCMQKFAVKDVETDALTNIWVRALVLAGRDVDASTLARRDISSAVQDSQHQLRRSAISKLRDAYSIVRPIAVEQLRALDQEMLSVLDAGDVEEWRIQNFSDWTRLLEITGDSLNRVKTARLFLEDVKRDPAKFRRIPRSVATIVDALEIVELDQLLDSLRKGAEAYVALKKTHWAYASGIEGGQIPSGIGQIAPPIKGDFWFESGEKTRSLTGLNRADKYVRPERGAVNLVVFLRGCRGGKPLSGVARRQTGNASACFGTYATVARLAKRYPGLKITLVSQTFGYIGQMNPMPPSKEAELLSKWWVGYHKLPVTLAVKQTDYFYLQEPDRRRIDNVDPNRESYMFDGLLTRAMRIQDVIGFLIDTNGMVVRVGDVDRVGEVGFRRLLDVMMARP